MKRILLAIAVVLALLAAVAAAVLTDGNIQRFTEDWLSASLGRQLRVEGKFTARLGVPLRLRAESVRLANPGWAKNPVMATAAVIEAAIDPWTLVGNKPLILNDLVIQGLEGELVSDDQGRANWHFGSDDSDSNANFLIQNLDIAKSRLEVRRYGLAAATFEIDTLRQVEDAEGLLETTLSGHYAGRPVTAKGQIGPFAHLLDGTDVRLAIKASLGTLEIDGIGLIDDVADPRQPRLDLDVKAPDAREVGEMFGIQVDTPSDIALQLRILPADTGVSIDGGGRWGAATVDVKGQVRDLDKLDGVELKASGKGPDLRGALQLFGFATLPPEAFSFAGDLKRQGQKLDVDELAFTVGDFVFHLDGDMRRFPSLNDADLRLSVKGDDVAKFRQTFGLPGVAKGGFSLDATLTRGSNGREEFRIDAGTELGNAVVTGTLGAAPNYAGTRVKLQGNGKDFGQLAELLGVTGLKHEPYLVNAELEVLDHGYRLDPWATLSVGQASLRAAGTLGKEPLVSGTQLDWSLDGVDVADIARVARWAREFPPGAISATGTATVRPDDVVLSKVQGSIGKAGFSLEGAVGRQDALRGTDLQIAARGPALEKLAFLFDNVNLPAGPFQVSGRLQRTATGLRISGSQIDIAGAKGKVDGELVLPADKLDASFDIEVSGPDLSAFWQGRDHVVFGQKPFAVDVRGTVNQDVWDLEDGLLKIGAGQLEATGIIRRDNPDGELKIRASTPEISTLARVFDVKVLPGRSLQLTGTLRRQGDLLMLNDFLARTNKGDLAGTFSYALGDKPTIKAVLTSTKLDISWLTEPAREELIDKRAEREAKDRKDGLLIPDWRLPMDVLQKANVDVQLNADQVERVQRDVRNLDIRLVIADGALTVDPWRFGGDSGSLDGTVHLAPTAEGADFALQLETKDIVTGLFTPEGTDIAILPRGNWNLKLSGRGQTVRELAAHLNGTGRLTTNSGRLPNGRGEALLFGDLFSNITSAVNPFVKKDPFTGISCAVFPFKITDGVMETAPSIVIQTDKLNIISHGKINLANEKLDLSFTSKPRSGIGISAGSVINPFVRIGGTMAKPEVTLDKTGALLTGGAAFFTAGLSILAKAAFDAAWRSPDPCGKVLAEAEKEFAKLEDQTPTKPASAGSGG